MLRSLVGQIISGAVVVAFVVGWWLAAGQDPGRMVEQFKDVALWLGHLAEPLFRHFSS